MRGRTDTATIEAFMKALGRDARGPGAVYFTGGVSAVLLGWRSTTIDVDVKFDPEPAGAFEALARLKESLDVNVELASPDDFVPALPGWQERSRFIARHGEIEFLHYDFYAQALAKIDRDHTQDRSDVSRMITSGLVEKARLLQLFESIEPLLLRYPAVDPEGFRKRVEAVCANDF